MPLSDVVNLTITLAPPPSDRPGFGTPLVVSEVSAEVQALWTDRTVRVTKNDFATVLTGLGFLTTDPLYEAVNDLFSQRRAPEVCLCGRREDPTAQVNQVDINGTTDGNFTVTINGTDFVFPASGNTATEIRDGLIALIDAGSEPVSTAVVDADSFSLTADEAGVSFTLATDHSVTPADISSSNTTPNEGIAEDLIAITAEDADWYCLIETSKSPGVILIAANSIESQRRIFLAQADEADVLTSATDDVASELQSLSRARTSFWWHDDDTEHADASVAGQCLPSDPGSITWAYQLISGIPADVDELTQSPIDTTGLANLRDKNGNYVENLAGNTVSRRGMMANGTFIDLIRSVDDLHASLTLAIVDLFVAEDVVPYTDEGIEQVVGVMLGVFGAKVYIVEDSVEINAPKKVDVPTADVADRNLPDITFSATARGAIQSVEITGTIEV